MRGKRDCSEKTFKSESGTITKRLSTGVIRAPKKLTCSRPVATFFFSPSSNWVSGFEMAYLAPIHRPSSVRHALKLNLLDPGEECLVLA
jgi:hypothetical protein